MNLSERLKKAMEASGTSQADLARACGVSAPSVHGWLSGKSKFLRGENLLKAARVLGVSQDWLATGSGSMRASADITMEHGLPSGTFRRVVAVDDDDPRITLIPKVRLRLTAGISGFHVEAELGDDSTSTVPTHWMRDRGFKKEHLIAIDVRGESMEPTFYAGDTAVLNTADKEPVDGGVFAINYEGEPVVKRMTRDAGQWWLTSDNSDQRRFPRKLCEGDGCIIIGRVVRKESERF